jgi:hypothetical protein
MDLERDPDVRIERDGAAVRQVLHLTRPFTAPLARSPEDLAALYLHLHAAVFGVDRTSLRAAPGMPPIPFWQALLARLRWLAPLRWLLGGRGARLDPVPTVVPVRDAESVAVVFRQVERVRAGRRRGDVAVWGAGVRLLVARAPLRLTLAYSTLRHDLPLALATRRVSLTAEAAAAEFGVPLASVEGVFVAEPGGRSLAATLVYGRMDDRGLDEGRAVPYREYLDLASGAVVRREVMASHAAATGLVFPVDPRSQTAGLEPAPYRPAPALDRYRARRTLRDLAAPVGAAPQELRGSRVYVAPDNPLRIAPPTRPVGADFDYTSRSDHFAAVSAYRHCDAAFRMVEALGFPLAEYFAGSVAAGRFPIRVVHRAAIGPGPGLLDGRIVNAQVVRADAPHAVGEIRFALGDLSDAWATSSPAAGNPVGIAADPRFVWHELGHVLLIAATGEPEFRFAHGAGDALAAVICDLDSRVASQAPAWRGVTFPWVQALRRHDRTVATGWAWHGTHYDRATYGDMRDPAGYRAEQLVSSTVFRLYRALGGDATQPDGAPDLVRRRAAAAYTVYLVVRAIQALGPATTTPALDAYALAGALGEADVATGALLPDASLFRPFRAGARRGGAVHKVVRWAFEHQGLWPPAGAPRPWNARGGPEAVDVFIEDGRRGEYDHAAGWHAAAPDVRVATAPDPLAPDAPPSASAPGHVFVRVWNRGTQPSPPSTAVRVFVARAASGPRRWRLAPGPANPWVELAPTPGAVTAAAVPAGGSVDFGPFEWRPRTRVRHGLLACVDAPGDRANALSPALACAVGPTRLEHLVPFDNNLAYREVVVGP